VHCLGAQRRGCGLTHSHHIGATAYFGALVLHMPGLVIVIGGDACCQRLTSAVLFVLHGVQRSSNSHSFSAQLVELAEQVCRHSRAHSCSPSPPVPSGGFSLDALQDQKLAQLVNTRAAIHPSRSVARASHACRRAIHDAVAALELAPA
jgi:hypothetical protein